LRILGIDPGSSATGYGIVEQSGARLVYVAHGVVRLASGSPLPERLAVLCAKLRDVVAYYHPSVAAVERVFVAAHPHAALVLGHVRGAVLVALAEARLSVVECSAAEIKRAVVGTGGAHKVQVQAMVAKLLGLARAPARDAADALAAAICCGHTGPVAALKRPARRRPRAAPTSLRWAVRRVP